jgi:photosystem II stability/assembly factor-like uncharacterized protein
MRNRFRKRLRLFHPTFLALVIALLFGTAGETAWEPVGPFGGGVRSLVSDSANPARMYLGTHTGQIHVTSDGARSWSRVPGFAPPANWVVDDLVIQPGEPRVLYAGMWSLGLGGGGIYKSTDGGESWTELRGMAGQAVRALAMATSDPRIVIAGTRDGVFRSDDAGERWRRISPLGHAEIRTLESVAIDPRDPDMVYVGTWHLPWKTTDGGRSWTLIHKGILDDSDVFSLAVNPADPNTLYIGACSGIYRTDTAAAQWRKIQGIPQSSRRTHTLVLDPRDPAIVYAGTTEGLWRSPDGGQAWARLTPQNWVINAVVLDPRDPNHFFLALDSLGVMETRDSGKTFQEANHGFAQRQVSRLVADPSEPGRFYAGLLHDGAHGGVYTTPDGGTSWQQLSAGLGGRDVRSLLLLRQSAMRLLAATPDGVFEYSPERGVWQNQSRWEIPASRPGAPAATVAVWDLFQRSPSEPIHAATSRGLFESRDGRDWKALRVSSNPVSVYGVATLGRDGRTIVAVTADATLISRDAGRSWSLLDLGAGPALKVHRVATHAATPDVLFVGTNLGLYRSTDAGRTWERFGRGVPFSPVLDVVISADDPKHVIVGSVGGVFHSLNGGDGFERTGDGAGLDTFPVQSLAFHPQGGPRGAILAASRSNGIFRSRASLLPRPE